MINIHNISNLEMFDQVGSPLSCPNDLQKAIEEGIAKKVGKLLNAEGFLALIPNFDPNEDTKLRIHLTKDGITIQLLERDTNNLKTDKSYSEDNQLVTPEIKTRKEKIIKKVDSLFKEPSAIDPSARLESKVLPLFISQPNKEQVPSKIHFDATLPNPQIQQLHAKIENLQNQLNKRTPYSEELQVIKDQLELLKQAIHNLSAKQENITYPHTEKYALINKLVDNQRDIYRALLDLLSRNLNQPPITPLTSPPAQGIENSTLKESLKLQQEKIDLKQTKDSFEDINTVLQNDLLSKEEQIIALEQQIQSLPKPEALQKLQSQLEILQSEKADLQSQQDESTSQLDELTQTSKGLESANATLQKNLLSKEEQIIALTQQIQNLPKPEALQKLQSQLFDLQREKEILEITLEDLQSALLEDLQSALPVKDEQIEEKSKILDQLQSELDISKKEKESLNKELFEFKYALSELGKDLGAYELVEENFHKVIEKAIERIEKVSQENPLDLDSLQTSIKEDLKQTITELQQKLEDISDEHEQLTSDVQRKATIIEKLEEEIITYKNLLSQSGAKNLEELIKRIDILTNLNVILEKSLDTKVSSEKDLKKKLEQAIGDLKQEKKYIQSIEEEYDEETKKLRTTLQLEQEKNIHQEEIYANLIENLEYEKTELAKNRDRIISTLIEDLEEKQKGSCEFLRDRLLGYVRSGAITKEEGLDIFPLIEPKFEDTFEYKQFINKSCDSSSDDEAKHSSLDEYIDELYFPNKEVFQD